MKRYIVVFTLRGKYRLLGYKNVDSFDTLAEAKAKMRALSLYGYGIVDLKKPTYAD